MKTLNPKTDEALTILQEECAEVIQIISKIKRWGFNSVHPNGGKSNRELLVQEIADVLALINFIQKDLGISNLEISDGIEEKFIRLDKYSGLFK